MAVGDFTAANSIAPILVELSSLWSQEKIQESVKSPMMLTKAIIENQGMRILEEEKNGKCVPTKIWWTNDCDYDAAYAGTSFDNTLGCDVPAGKEDEAFSDTLDLNKFIHDTRSFDDQDCNSELFMVNRSAERINAGIKAVRRKIVNDFATFMSANAMVNQAQAGETYGTIVGTTTTFQSSEFTLSLLAHLEKLAALNEINQYKIVNGWNFWEQYRNAQQGTENGDAGDVRRASTNNLLWDTWLDRTLGTNSSFIFDPTSIGFANIPRFRSSAPELLHNQADGSQIWGWQVSDPELSYLRIDENGRAVMTPVRYDIEYKRICAGRDAGGYFKYTHSFTVHFRGGVYLSPQSCNGGSKILEVINTNA